jgi:hypothetical protein
MVVRPAWPAAPGGRPGEEDGVDQLGLAARELGDEGQHQPVGRQALAQRGEGRGLRFVDQVVVDQEARQHRGGTVHLGAPDGQLIQL